MIVRFRPATSVCSSAGGALGPGFPSPSHFFVVFSVAIFEFSSVFQRASVFGKTLDVDLLQVRRVRWHILRRGDEQDFSDPCSGEFRAMLAGSRRRFIFALRRGDAMRIERKAV